MIIQTNETLYSRRFVASNLIFKTSPKQPSKEWGDTTLKLKKKK